MSSDLRLAITTCGSRDVADRIATALVERRLAACVNVLPGVSSTYRWMGKIETDDEVLMLIKTARSELTAIEGLIKALAGYELPELVAVEIAGGAADYLDWVASSVGEETA
ncbi:MAG TPA: divalent-cation tolerance protein CutA [Gammaproteobacteria bacterium]|nr:divalent-cation tolerance protein CutA [Gammaproteobacteria bacterium]